MTTTITISDQLLTDLKLIKRILDKNSFEEVIRALMDARGYNEKWLEYMDNFLKGEAANTKEVAEPW